MGGKSKGKQSPDPFNSLFPKRKSISPIIPMMKSTSLFPRSKPMGSMFPKMKSQPLIPKFKKQRSGLTSLFPKSKPMGSIFPKMKSQPLIPKFKRGKSIIPSMNMPQNIFLKRTSGMKQRFTDHDRDGVISGLDCYPFDKKRHYVEGPERKTIPHWLFNQLSPEQREEAKEMIFKENTNISTVAKHYNVDYNPYENKLHTQYKTSSRSEKIKILQDKAKELGRAPKSKEMKAVSDSPRTGAFVKEFGSWNKALEEAGLEPHRTPISTTTALEKIESEEGIPTPNKIVNMYKERPETKEKIKEYSKEYEQRQETKERHKEYSQLPENQKKRREYFREYRKRPEIKEKIKEYEQRPERKERVKEYKKEHDAENYNIKKALKETEKEATEEVVEDIQEAPTQEEDEE